jgi:hypothetical protein
MADQGVKHRYVESAKARLDEIRCDTVIVRRRRRPTEGRHPQEGRERHEGNARCSRGFH